jgi:hypothetical protein
MANPVCMTGILVCAGMLCGVQLVGMWLRFVSEREERESKERRDGR